jgi:hypothetical protein
MTRKLLKIKSNYMSIINKTTLKTFYENGDIPDQDDFSNLIDSYAGEVDSADNRTIDAENRILYKSDGASRGYRVVKWLCYNYLWRIRSFKHN